MSTLYTDNIRANNASQITVPTGQKIVGTDSGSIVAPGHIIQVVEGAVTTNSTTSSTSFSDTGLSVSITPKSVNNKILARVDVTAYNSVSGHNHFLMLVRDTTPIGHGGTGTTDNDTASAFTIASPSALNGREGSFSISVLDSPATTSQITYKIRFRAETGSDTAHFNYLGNSGTLPRSTITLMEIAQ